MLLNVTVPVYNEERVIAGSIERIILFLNSEFPESYEVVIANNGSTDDTMKIAMGLEAKYKQVRLENLLQKGRGGALRAIWAHSRAEVLSYMDVDLSSDLRAFPKLIEPLVKGVFDIAIGSRLLRPELTRRCVSRGAISRAYNYLIRALFQTQFSDAQCGFKGITRAAADHLLPLVQDNGWFFDTELLLVAERLGYRIFDLPVLWTESTTSSVKICRTAFSDLRGLLRLRRQLKQIEAVHRPRVSVPARSLEPVSVQNRCDLPAIISR